MPDFVRDVTRSNAEAELVTAKEREALGYERPEDVDNPAVQRLALANREAIEAEVSEQVERALGRPVEVVNFDATYPYRALDVTCMTLDEPLVGVTPMVSLRADGRVGAVDTESMNVQDSTVSSLYALAYPERLAAMRAYLAREWPQFGGVTDGYARTLGLEDPNFRVQFDAPLGGYLEVDAWMKGIYEAFRENPDRPVSVWREMFEAAPELTWPRMRMHLMARDPATVLSEELVREVADGVRADSAFAGVESWSISVVSNLARSRGLTFHQDFWLQIDPDRSDWHVIELRDGATTW